MSDYSPVRIILESDDEEHLEEWAIRYLKKKGWTITNDVDWEKPIELARRLGVTAKTVWLTMNNNRCPQPRDVIRGNKSNKIVFLKSTPELDAFITKYKRLDNLTAQVCKAKR